MLSRCRWVIRCGFELPILGKRVHLHRNRPVDVLLPLLGLLSALLLLPVADGGRWSHNRLRYGSEGLRRRADLRLARLLGLLGRLRNCGRCALRVEVKTLGRRGELALCLDELRL